MTSTSSQGPVGRFAPSPSGSLHLGNLRTALLAWCVAKGRGGQLLLRMEDLTTGAAPLAEAEQIADLALLGIEFDGQMLRQSERSQRYDSVIAELTRQGLTYECYCTRKEIAEASAAPHGQVHAYPGTCRDLSVSAREQLHSAGRRPAIRIKAASSVINFVDEFAGENSAVVDDFVLQRGDGLAAYNFAVVIDDADSGVDQVVRGDDLIESTSRQILLQQMLGFPRPTYIHVPLVLGTDGQRLSKRHGSVGLGDQLRNGADPGRVRGLLAASIGIPVEEETIEMHEILRAFDLDMVPREAWILDPNSIKW